MRSCNSPGMRREARAGEAQSSLQSSPAIRRHKWSSDALSGSPRQSQRPSEVINVLTPELTELLMSLMTEVINVLTPELTPELLMSLMAINVTLPSSPSC